MYAASFQFFIEKLFLNDNLIASSIRISLFTNNIIHIQDQKYKHDPTSLLLNTMFSFLIKPNPLINLSKQILEPQDACFNQQMDFLRQHIFSISLGSAKPFMLCHIHIHPHLCNMLFIIFVDDACRLDWDTCYKIIKGVCEGLAYLHKSS